MRKAQKEAEKAHEQAAEWKGQATAGQDCVRDLLNLIGTAHEKTKKATKEAGEAPARKRRMIVAPSNLEQ